MIIIGQTFYCVTKLVSPLHNTNTWFLACFGAICKSLLCPWTQFFLHFERGHDGLSTGHGRPGQNAPFAPVPVVITLASRTVQALARSGHCSRLLPPLLDLHSCPGARPCSTASPCVGSSSWFAINEPLAPCPCRVQPLPAIKAWSGARP